MLRSIAIVVATITWLFAVADAQATPVLKALIVDGQNNHDWRATTPILRKHLEQTGLFTVDVATSAPQGEDLSDFQPNFAAYDVIVSNYNGEPWSVATQKAFVDYVGGGGGFVVVHAANNAFPLWKDYNEMIGLGWRGPEFGDRLTLDDAGKPVRTPKGQGPGAGHGPQHAFAVIVRDPKHPITKGFPASWLHATDELYHDQRGPASNMHVLATAYSDSGRGGTAAHEPMLWVIPFGKGRVFTTLLGHSTEAMKCVGFMTTLERGAEWAATGKVTRTVVPADFPTADTVSTRKQD
jgi:uncharacterized protein